MDPKEHAPGPGNRRRQQGRATWFLGLGCLALAIAVVACSSSPFSRRLATPKVVRQFAQTVRPPSSESTRLLNNATILRSMGRSHLAVKELEEALQRDPGNLKVVDALAQCYEDLGDYPRAQALYEAALAQHPRHSALRNNLGFSYYQSGQWQKAESCLREAVTLDPANRQARNNLGLLLVRQGRHAEALALWQEWEREQVARELLAQAVAAAGERTAVQTARLPEAQPAPARPLTPPPAAGLPSSAKAPDSSGALTPQSQSQSHEAAYLAPASRPSAAPSPEGEAVSGGSPPRETRQAAGPSPQESAATGTATVAATASKPAGPAPSEGVLKTVGVSSSPVVAGSPGKYAASSEPRDTSRPSKPTLAVTQPSASPMPSAPVPHRTLAKPSPRPVPIRVGQSGATSDGRGPSREAATAITKDPPAPAPATIASQPAVVVTRPEKKASPAPAQSESQAQASPVALSTKEAAPSSQELLEHRLVLLNGNGSQGIAKKHREWLEMEGFAIAEVGNFRDFGQQNTSISYLPGARRVVALLVRTCYPQADVKETPSLPEGASIKVILGRDQLAREAKVDQRLAKLRASAPELATRSLAAAPKSLGPQRPAGPPTPSAAAASPQAHLSPSLPPTPVSLTAAELISTRISLRNGNGKPDIARAYRTLLSRQGFTVIDIGNHIDFGAVHTEILYRPEAARVARSLAARFFPQARLKEASLADDLEVKVVLGQDLAGPFPELLAHLGP